MTIEQILQRLSGVRRSGGGWIARCPAHEDRNPSLSIHEVDGAILLHCFGGCRFHEIAAAMGLAERDFFAGKARGVPVACYDYVDENDILLYQTVRFRPKNFRQRRPDGSGGWIWNLDGVRRVLYNLPQVLKAKFLLVVEGEKDVAAARQLGAVATCNAGGAGKWRPEYGEILRGKDVCVICDADASGVRHGRDVAQSLVGLTASLKLIEALPASKDLSEWVAKGGTQEALLEIIKQTPELTQADVSAWKSSATGSGFHFTLLHDLMREPEELVPWLLEGVLPAGGLSLLAAKPKAGKSTLARCLALAVASGEEFLGRATLQGPVLYLALEEKRAEVRAHFRAMGAVGEEEIFIHVAHAPADALPAITQEIKARRPVLLIVDPLLRFTRVKDGNDYTQVTTALEPLLILARESGAHVLLVHHLGKRERAEPTDSILGSTALFASVDTALVMRRTDRYRTIQSRQRYGEDLAESVLIFDPERRTLSLGAERLEADALAVSEEILKFLADAKEGKTEPEINQSVEGSNAAKRKAIRRLVADGKAERSGSGKRGEPFIYRFSYSCPTDMLGTRVQETPKVADPRINTGAILVPASEQKSFLVRDIEEGEL